MGQLGAQNGPKSAQIGPKIGPWRLLGGLWAAKSIFERNLSDFEAYVEAMLEAKIV